jgi:tripartite motif-containing protein 2/3/tripartite motif-containing protein 71
MATPLQVTSRQQIEASEVSQLDKIKDQLTCPVCLEVYDDPRCLPCLHSFCLKCLDNLPLIEDEQSISCPSCRAPTQLPDEGARGFPISFMINNFKDIYSFQKETSDQPQQVCEVCAESLATSYCKDCEQFLCQNCHRLHMKFKATKNHKLLSLDDIKSGSQLLTKTADLPECSNHNKPLSLFCKQCNVGICLKCIVFHIHHNLDEISDCYDKQLPDLKAHLKNVSEKLAIVEKKANAITKRENEIREQEKHINNDVHLMVEQMIKSLRESEIKIIADVATTTNYKLEILAAQQESTEGIIHHLKECKDFVEQSLKFNTPLQILMSEQQMINRVDEVIERFNANFRECDPLEENDVMLQMTINNPELIGKVTYTIAPEKINKFNCHSQITFENDQFSFLLSLEFDDLFTVPLSSFSCSVVSTTHSQPIDTTVAITNMPAVYKISCSPIVPGCHQVHVQIYNNQLNACSSVNVPVCTELQTPIHTIENVGGPWGIAVCKDGNFIVAANNIGKIKMFDKEGIEMKSFPTGNEENKYTFTQPRGVAVTPDNFILVTDDANDLVKISMDGELIASFKEQNPETSLDYIWGVTTCTSPNSEKIYVVDHSRGNIGVFNSDLLLVSSFNAYLRHPYFVATDDQGMVYVSGGQYDGCIGKFTPNGEDVLTITNDTINTSCGITIHNNLLYVTDWNNTISIFTTDGQFVHHFDSSKVCLDKPVGIAFNQQSNVMHICSYNNSKVYNFNIM